MNPNQVYLYTMNYIQDLQSLYNVARQAPVNADIHDAAKAAAERVAKFITEQTQVSAAVTQQPLENINS